MKLPVAILSSTIGVVTAQTVADFSPVVESGAYTTLLQAISATGADTVINQNLPVTILGPTDDAFALASTLIDNLSNEELSQIILDHVVFGFNYTKANLEQEGGCVVVTTAGGTEISIFVDAISGEMDVDGILVVDQDVIGDQYVLHGIESVIIPGQHFPLYCPDPSPPADFTPLEILGKYNTFIGALNRTGLSSLLGQYDSFLVAPTDEALAAANIADLSDDELKEVLENHLIPSYAVYSDAMINIGCIEATTLGGLRVAFRYNEDTGGFSVNGIPINSDTDIEGNFGLSHGLDGVLDGSSEFISCLDFVAVSANGKYNTLVAALEQTKVTETIADATPVTILGPTDEALAAIQDTIDTLSPEEFKTVIANHVLLYDDIGSEYLMFEGCIDRVTEGGMRLDLRYDMETGKATVNGIPIIEFDIRGNFGVLHGIDGVLIDETVAPYTPCIDFTPVVDAGKYGSFLSALEDNESIFESVIYFKPLTLLAPTDEAFARLDPSVSVSDIIPNHVVYDFNLDGISSGCVDSQTGGGLNVAIRYDSETGVGNVNGIPIIEVNLSGNFGVVHGIDGVLIEGVAEYSPCADFSPIDQVGNYASFMNVLTETKQNELISIISPVTFFGPTDGALALVQDTLDTLTDEEVLNALSNHIIAYPSNVTVEYVKSEGCVDLYTLGSLEISIRYNETTGIMTVNNIPVVDVDVDGNYGVFHGIDGVLGVDGDYFPCAFDDDTAAPGEPTFEILDEIATEFQRPLFTAVLAAGESSATIFGPSDAAFSIVKEPGSEEGVLEILKGHVVAGRITSDQIKSQGCMILDTLAGTKIRAMFVADEGAGGRRLAGHTGGTIMINDAKVIARVEAEQALIHGIDKVILPGGSSFEECPTEAPVAAPTESPAAKSAAFAARLSFVFGCMIVLSTL